MRKVVLVALVLAAGCGRQTPNGPSPAADQMASDGNSAGGNVAPTLVPGVALDYSYSFRLPIEQVARTQEQHAGQCEALGPARCRITGMDYHAGTSRVITASLKMKLAPALARRFGKQGIAVVVANGGMLSDSEITSTDAGTTIATAERNGASMGAEQQQIIQQLARPGLGSAERTQLQARLAELREAQRGGAADRAAAALLLASTPMSFSYASGTIDPGYSDGPVLGAVKDGWANIVAGFAVLLTLLISLLPWAVAALLIVWLVRRFGGVLGLRGTPD